jgi:hypothetical protein
MMNSKLAVRIIWVIPSTFSIFYFVTLQIVVAFDASVASILGFENGDGVVDVGAADGALFEVVGAGFAGHQVLAGKKHNLESILLIHFGRKLCEKIIFAQI